MVKENGKKDLFNWGGLNWDLGFNLNLDLGLNLDLDIDYNGVDLRSKVNVWATEWEVSMRDGVHQRKDSEQDVNVSWALHCFSRKSQAKELLKAGLNQKDQFLRAYLVQYHKDKVSLVGQVQAKLPQESSHLHQTSEKDSNILGYPPKSGNACSSPGLSSFSITEIAQLRHFGVKKDLDGKLQDVKENANSLVTKINSVDKETKNNSQTIGNLQESIHIQTETVKKVDAEGWS